ncbi:MAG TPA: winged helix-turn-helix domain-containing protein, partial [Terracidiphilus sp.]|nr:winged helix-turn-helix domain-containing protein [Terracidiphilus sp.]
MMASRRVQFGVFEVDLQAEELRRSGVRVRLQSQPFKVLTTLLEHPGEVVSRETLQHQLWGNDTTVDFDHGLGIAVNKLRDALGDSAESPRFVETLARKGYRFIAPVRPLDLPPAPASVAAAAPQASRRFSTLAWSLAAIATVGCLVLALFIGLRPPSHTPYRISQVTFSGRVLTNDLDVASFSSSATDGTRIYYSQLENGEPTIAVALAANGEVTHLRLPSAIIAPLVASLSSDGSQLVVHSHLQSLPEQPLWIVPTLGGDAQRVPNVLAHDATWMPDGAHRLVASGNSLSIVGTDGTEVRKFATVPGLAYWLRWSPDGSVLRFTIHDPGSQTTKLWEIRSDGSHLHPLFPSWDRQGSDCCGSWTPNGDHFVFESSHGGHGNIWMLNERPWFRRSSTPTPITQGPLGFSAPITAPNSNHVYFIGSTSQFELLRAEPGSSTFTSLGPDLSAASLAQYSLDGKWVAWLNGSDNSLWCG